MRRSDREITDKSEMIDILNRGESCHIALVEDGKPYLVAMNYGFSWDQSGLFLYFHSAGSGRKLDIIRKNGSACFIVDIGHELIVSGKGCNCSMKYRSVIGKGKIEIVTDDAEKKKGLDLLMEHYIAEPCTAYESGSFREATVIRMTVGEITGKKRI